MHWMKQALLAGFALSCVVASTPTPAAAFATDFPGDGPEPPFVICENQVYALCATAECFVYGEVAYCRCDILKGDSISLSLTFDSPIGERDVCSVNEQGRFSGYMVSTYSYPKDVAVGGSEAVYTCPGVANADGGVAAPVAYAQCDGGLCFTSTNARFFPGFPERAQANEIMCSCPIATGSTQGSSNPNGYQISGPYDASAPPGQRCDPATCELCSVKNPDANGASLRVGAASGVPNFLTLRLYGPPLLESNECQCKCTEGADGSVSCTVAD